MDKGGDQKCERRRGEDRLSNLPESLLCQIMLNIPTKDVVKSSVLSRRWRNLWRFVPGLNVEYSEFLEYNTFVSFVDKFLGLNRESCFQSFRLRYDGIEGQRNIAHVKRWINVVVSQKVKDLDVLDYAWGNAVQIPPTVYTCESLVSLKLCNVILANPNFISLPSLKAVELDIVKFANVLVLEKLISSCTALETLIISRSPVDGVYVLRVRSRSLLSFKHIGDCSDGWDGLEVSVDAPKLEYLNLSDHTTANFRIKNSASLVEADINIIFNIQEELPDPNDGPKRNMIRDFFVGISSVKKLFISSYTLEVIYDLRCELPLFHNLSSLHIDLEDHSLKMLSTFLESCPNLKYLVVEFKDSSKEDGVRVVSVPRCFLTSLEYVKIERPITGEARGMKLVSYILENSAILKKLTLSLDSSRKKEESVILKELLTIPRLSTSCKVLVCDPRSCWGLV